VSAVPTTIGAQVAAVPTVVRDCSPSDAARWDAFVTQCPGATFFHRFGWQRIIKDEFRHATHYLLAERGGAMVGVLPLAEIRSRLFGNSLVSMPFGVYGGPAATGPDVADALIEAAAHRARRLDVDYLELRNRGAHRPDWPRQDLYVTFRREIAADNDENLQGIPRKQRAMVRKGIKNGLVGVVDTSADRFFDLYADNMHRHGSPPFARRYFERLRDEFGGDCEILTILDRAGVPVSSVLSFYFRDEVLPYYAGDSLAARDLAANDFKYWDLMRRASDRGIRCFDYGRSKRGTGSFDFKKNWGFDAEPLNYEYLLLRRQNVPQNNPANPRYRALIAIWRRLPRTVANAMGPFIVRNLA